MKKLNLEKDFIDFLRLCNKYELEYLVIGGYAVAVHGYPRYTKDIDISIGVSGINAERMLQVIDEFGFSILQLQKSDFLKRGGVIQLGQEPVRIDILNGIESIPFEEAFSRKNELIYEGVNINIISLDDLIITKKLAGRPQDLADIDKLIRRNRNK